MDRNRPDKIEGHDVQDQNKKEASENAKHQDLKQEVMEVQVGDPAVNRISIAVKDHKILEEYFGIDQEKLLTDKRNGKMTLSEILEQKDLQGRAEDNQQKQDVGSQLPAGNPDNAATQSSPLRPSRVIPPMPSEETMRHAIADNLMEILVNMTNPQRRQQCFSLLQVGDALQARSRILGILQRIDEGRTTRR
ncbi:uncharacterized protein LOC6550732 [Drosophila erecta]|uniref:Uncharacterized protein n=1 Tax=Drosophila erecta TaxID=7220 RepID=B3NUY4_DROER|nr:uncharacterized protein LOC6550732 [Drosophila erecta]EDV47082.1 uncharacterized protein Dere_GG17853 [Drosophila erecta]